MGEHTKPVLLRIVLILVSSGTSWGAIPFHGVYTSYDYGATVNFFLLLNVVHCINCTAPQIAESRALTTKFDELKRQALFLRSSQEFYKTDWVADASTGLAISTNSAAFITFLRNPDTSAGFYIARQADSTSTYASSHFDDLLLLTPGL